MRGDATFNDPGLTQRVHGTLKDASFQVIVLGASGGPREDTVTGLLVRAPQAEWRKGSVIAVDAGVHLASIVRILQQQMPLYSKEKPPKGYSQVIPDGPFAGIKCPGYSARANALYIFRELMHAFLITHPHLDHLSAMGINTPALEYGREAKTIVALDSTIEAIKSHIFNDSIWPNLSDEGSGVGFVTYRRLKEGGNSRLGSGDARGYVRVCDSLATLCMGVSHGKCKSKPASLPHHRAESAGWHDGYSFPSQRRLSRISDHESYFAAVHSHSHSQSGGGHPPASGAVTPGYSALHTPTLNALDADHAFEPVRSSAFFILNEETASEILIFGDIEPDSVSISPQNYKIWRTAAPKIASGSLKAIFIECSYDDSVRDADLYGHLCPRHLIQELLFLAREVADYKTASNIPPLDTPVAGNKRAFEQVDTNGTARKRKRVSEANSIDSEPTSPAAAAAVAMSVPASTTSPYVGTRSNTAGRRKTSLSTSTLPGDLSPRTLRGTSPTRSHQPAKHVHFDGRAAPVPRAPAQVGPSMSPSPRMQPAAFTTSPRYAATQPAALITSGHDYPDVPPDPMEDLVVHIIHVKDTLADGPTPGEIILAELRESAAAAGLQCEFDVTDFGESIWI